MLQCLIERQNHCRVALFSPDSPLECYEASFCAGNLEYLELAPLARDQHSVIFFNMFEVFKVAGIRRNITIEPQYLAMLNKQTIGKNCHISQELVSNEDFILLKCADFEQVLVFDFQTKRSESAVNESSDQVTRQAASQASWTRENKNKREFLEVLYLIMAALAERVDQKLPKKALDGATSAHDWTLSQVRNQHHLGSSVLVTLTNERQLYSRTLVLTLMVDAVAQQRSSLVRVEHLKE